MTALEWSAKGLATPFASTNLPRVWKASARAARRAGGLC
jgi:hypothetical protein